MMEMTEKKPKVSVCVVTYNQENYIRQCLQSIVDQATDFDFEIIVGDDCSTDGTPSIVYEFLEKYPKIFKAIFHEKNMGGVKNYLDVHNLASGEYIAHMDGDDFWLSGKLKAQIDFLQTNLKCTAVYSNAVVVSKSEKFMGIFNNKIPEMFEIGYLLQKGNFLNNSSFVYRSAIRKKIFPLKENFIDYHVHLRCALHGNLGFINKVLVGYRRVSNGIASSSSGMVRNLYWQALADIYRIDKKTPHLKSAISDFMASIICVSLRNGNFREMFVWWKIVKKDAGLIGNQVLIVSLAKAVGKIIAYVRNNFLPKKYKSIIFSPR